MTLSYRELRQDQYDLIPGFGFASTVTSDGQVNQLEDVVRLKNSLMVAEELTGRFVFRPEASEVSDRWREIARVDASTGILTPVTDWTAPPLAEEPYEVMGIMNPDQFFALVQRVMRRTPISDRIPLSTVADGDMEAQDVLDWTSDGGSGTKVTDPVLVHTGARALQVTAATALGGLLSEPRPVVSGDQVYASVNAIRVSGAGARAAFYDATNGVEFGQAVVSTLSRITRLALSARVPATCQALSLRLSGIDAGDVVVFDSICGPFQAGDNIIRLPAWVTAPDRISKVMSVGFNVSVSGLTDAFAAVYDDWDEDEYDVLTAPHAANPGQLYLTPQRPRHIDIWLETLRPASDYTTFTNTAAGEAVQTRLPRDLITAVVASEIFRVYLPQGKNARLDMARARVEELVAREQGGRPVKSKAQRNRVLPVFRI